MPPHGARGGRLHELTVIERELSERRERAYCEAVVRAAHDPSPEVERELGPRPESLAEQERWDRTALALERYRLRYGEIPGPELPADPTRRSAWEKARGELEELRARELPDCAPDRGTPAQIDLDAELGP